MSNLTKIEGIGEVYMAKLKAAGVTSTEQLLEKGSTPSGRKELETTTGIAHALLLRWINNADLFRIKGIGENMPTCLRRPGSTPFPNWPNAVPRIWRPN